MSEGTRDGMVACGVLWTILSAFAGLVSFAFIGTDDHRMQGVELAAVIATLVSVLIGGAVAAAGHLLHERSRRGS